MTDLTQAFARLIEALEKDYCKRNEGDVEWRIEIGRSRIIAWLYVYDNDDKMVEGKTRYFDCSSPLSSSDSIPAAIALCCDRLREKVGK